MNTTPPEGIECLKEGFYLYNYDIVYGQNTIGKARVEQVGLYYHFICQCVLPCESVHYVILQSGDRQFNLGVCVPNGDKFQAYKRIPVKEFEKNDFHFRLIPKEEKSKLLIEPDPEKPFAYLQNLQDARLDVYEKGIQIVLDETKYSTQDQQGSDQSQESQRRS